MFKGPDILFLKKRGAQSLRFFARWLFEVGDWSIAKVCFTVIVLDKKWAEFLLALLLHLSSIPCLRTPEVLKYIYLVYVLVHAALN